MEANLLRFRASRSLTSHDCTTSFSVDHVTLSIAVVRLKDAIEGVRTILQSRHHVPRIRDVSIEQTPVTVMWLMKLCENVSSELLSPEYVARVVIEASNLDDEAKQQAMLFDSLEESETTIQFLMEIAPQMSQIRKSITLVDLEKFQRAKNPDSVESDTTDLRRQTILQEVSDAAQTAALAKAEYESITGNSLENHESATHTITRTSHRELKKNADKAAKRAAQLLKRAKDEGIILDGDANDFLALNVWDDTAGFGSGGLVNRTEDEVRALQLSLLPEGTRQHYDKRGLPHGAEREETDSMEKVTIPAVKPESILLHSRLNIADVIPDPQMSLAFAGTKSLNPMQSETFQIAFHSRDNMLVCAPTGAGKTNVAMLATVSHFRDAGVIGRNVNETDANMTMEIGKKVVYIAPMKALAQEVVEKFSSKLKALKLIVRELTGDMQLSRVEAETANVIVTTPEKWDVVTRKSGTDEKSLGNQCGLLIIDEVHLLADDRGAVIESVVSRLQRLVETRQRQVRIVALSATLPNYLDVAEFLRVPPTGLFYFGPEHRPVPLQQTFIGLKIKSKDRTLREGKLNEVCFDTVLHSLQRGYQVMVFVHSRKGTGDTVAALAEIAAQEGVLDYFSQVQNGPNDVNLRYKGRVQKSRNKQLASFFQQGMGIHHAGMLRGDRKLTEDMFNDGAIRVLCCTATLAWGVNLPAHTVVIKGTEVYNPEKGGITDLSILDVQQIFGRAGRPQFDTSGEATLITFQENFQRYMDKLVRPIPIESNFVKQLPDHLNAEVVSGTVSNLKDAATWLTYTYLYVRMLKNPLAYGINSDEKIDDPRLHRRCHELVANAARFLNQTKMLRLHEVSGELGVTNNGRVAAHYYIQAESMETFNDLMIGSEHQNNESLCMAICSASEFRSMRLRAEEMDELQKLVEESCPMSLKGAGDTETGIALVTSPVDKAFVLLQAYIGRVKIKSFTLVSDMNYIASNAARVARALFEICLKSQSSGSAVKLLRIAKSIENQRWWFQTPLRHFESELSETVFVSLESSSGRSRYDTLERLLDLLDMQAGEVGSLCVSNAQAGGKIQSFIRLLPRLVVECDIKPVSGSLLICRISLLADFAWNNRWHGVAQSFWVWVEDTEGDKVFHCEQVLVSKINSQKPTILSFSLPLFNSSSRRYTVRTVSDVWAGIEQVLSVPLANITIPTTYTPYTALLNLSPLPTSALGNAVYKQLYSKFSTFNPIQTQLFHILYHTNLPVLLGAPTASGKTVVAELAIMRMKALEPQAICVYIAPMKALARERLKEWQLRFGSLPLNWKVLELSGDTSYDQVAIKQADILVCTPEKWDLVSRGWRRHKSGFGGGDVSKSFIERTRLLVLDEVHLLGEDRGAVLEAIVSRTRFISQFLRTVNDAGAEEKENEGNDVTRIIALSTSLANPGDVADWIGIRNDSNGNRNSIGVYNFQSTVRPVPTTVAVRGFPGKHYCPRMASMNKPCFAAIKQKSPTKPVIIFVGSRRQTRLTALDLISYAAGDGDPKIFLHCNDDYIEALAEGIQDESLRHTITFGIGLHHAGLSSADRDIVEKLFLERKIQVLLATATLAWGVNLPAHFVIVKGTEFFDGKTSRYVDYPVTDVLQMVGRAGRPGFDTEAQAMVMVSEYKKEFYKKFLYNPFPIESCLSQRLPEVINAEIVSGTISSSIECLGYLAWTFFARRVRSNPSFYGAKSTSDEDVGEFLHSVVTETVARLRDVDCVIVNDEVDTVLPTCLGLACSTYYLNHQTPKQMRSGLHEFQKILNSILEDSGSAAIKAVPDFQQKSFERSSQVDDVSAAWLLYILCSTHEFDEHPVRHNEEILNENLSKNLMWGHSPVHLQLGRTKQHNASLETFKNSHTKCFLLIQAYLERHQLPISDYVNDTKTVLDNIPRLLAAMEFIASKETMLLVQSGSFELQTQFSRAAQLIRSRCKVDSHPLEQLPIFGHRQRRSRIDISSFPLSLSELRRCSRKDASSRMITFFEKENRNNLLNGSLVLLYSYPLVTIQSVTAKLDTTDKRNDADAPVGMVALSLMLERELGPTLVGKNDPDSFTCTMLVGSCTSRKLLAHDTIRLNRSGKWEVRKTLSFDWNAAVTDAGEENKVIVIRLLYNEIRGMDVEMLVKIDC